jgi:outer membrane protein assembly factor BamC
VKLFRIAALAVLVSTSTGCATVKSWFSDDPEQKPEQVYKFQDKLKLPEGYTQPKKSTEFDIPKGSVPKGDTYVTSPSSVLAVFPGSWINEDDPHPAKIMLERPELVDDFPEFVKRAIESYAANTGINLTPTDKGFRAVQTLKVETGFWFWKDQEDTETLEYDLTVDFKPHGRSGALSVDPVEFTVLNKDLASKLDKDFRVEALSIQVLNDISLELNYLYRVDLKKEQASLDVSLALGKDVGGNAVVISQQEIAYVWSQIDDLVEDLGFSIVEEDKDLFILELTYDKDQRSFWDSLFSSDHAYKLDLDAGEYEMLLTTTTKGVHIKFRTKSGQMLNEQQVEQIYSLLKAIVEEDELEI